MFSQVCSGVGVHGHCVRACTRVRCTRSRAYACVPVVMVVVAAAVVVIVVLVVIGCPCLFARSRIGAYGAVQRVCACMHERVRAGWSVGGGGWGWRGCREGFRGVVSCVGVLVVLFGGVQYCLVVRVGSVLFVCVCSGTEYKVVYVLCSVLVQCLYVCELGHQHRGQPFRLSHQHRGQPFLLSRTDPSLSLLKPPQLSALASKGSELLGRHRVCFRQHRNDAHFILQAAATGIDDQRRLC